MKRNREISDVDVEIAIAMTDVDYLGNGTLSIEKLSAIISLHALARAYRKEGFLEETIIRPIILKKIEFIKSATKKSQLSEILKPPKVRYDGNKIQPIGPYAIPEEELILWSYTSLRGPLTTPGFMRYTKLFREIFPELADECGICG